MPRAERVAMAAAVVADAAATAVIAAAAAAVAAATAAAVDVTATTTAATAHLAGKVASDTGDSFKRSASGPKNISQRRFELFRTQRTLRKSSGGAQRNL